VVTREISPLLLSSQYSIMPPACLFPLRRSTCVPIITHETMCSPTHWRLFGGSTKMMAEIKKKIGAGPRTGKLQVRLSLATRPSR
jgi:hypothetical protein